MKLRPDQSSTEKRIKGEVARKRKRSEGGKRGMKRTQHCIKLPSNRGEVDKKKLSKPEWAFYSAGRGVGEG